MRLNYLIVIVCGAVALLPPMTGCRRGADQDEPRSDQTVSTDPGDAVTFAVTGEELLAARLQAAEASAGWIRLFDGHTLFGWDIAGEANWRVTDNRIVVDSGEQSLLCTSLPWQNFELVLDYKAPEQSNSGIFLRTPLEPTDPSSDCYEVNIAPTDHPFPVGSVVQRQAADPPASSRPAEQWQSMNILMDGGRLEVSINGTLVCEFVDDNPLPAGRIGLQHNRGRIEFRNIRLRPLGLTELLEKDLSNWKQYPEMPGEFSMTEEGFLRVQGGRTQLESKLRYADFVLFTEYKLPTAEMNSGIFFRCIPGDEMMGYECQLSHAVVAGNPLSPADCGSGGIFRRQDARIVAGEEDQWTTLLLAVHERTMAAWVNGLQVSNYYDDRQPHENPRKGLRLRPGTLMIQGHDPDTDVVFKQLKAGLIE